jgi:hypothetical protein
MQPQSSPRNGLDRVTIKNALTPSIVNCLAVCTYHDLLSQ